MSAKSLHRETVWQTKVVFLGLPDYNSVDSFAGKEIFSKRKISSTKEIHSVFIIYWIILLQCANIL